MEVTLEQMLEARENRASRQISFIQRYGLPVVSFSMNIPGPVKYSALIARGFYEGCRTLEHRLPKHALVDRQIHETVTGCEAIYVLQMDAVKIKTITTEIEDTHGLGRLFDMDVIDTTLQKLERSQVGGKSRDCMVCGARGRGCAARRAHSVGQLQETTNRILVDFFARADARQIGVWAVQSLLDEVCTTPKPGLVDRRNRGSHRDMDLFTFMAGASALGPYFQKCVQIGQETCGDSPEETFSLLRQEGRQAEQQMYEATGGVNTHKGAVFTMGILCGAAGRLWNPEGVFHGQELFAEVSAMTQKPMQEDFRCTGTDTAGERLYRQKGIPGIRGEAAQGLPSVRDIGLPVYDACRKKGMDQNQAGVITLLHLIAHVKDTNMISRGGLEGAEEAADAVKKLLKEKEVPEITRITALDDWFIEKNLSPGGCADLLAAVYFVSRLC